MYRCVVPGCLNLLQEWTTQFPRTQRLSSRWKEAIEVGTGQVPSVTSTDARICKAHFAVPSELCEDDYDEFGGDDDDDDYAKLSTGPDRYQEPRLFFRDNILTQVAECKLCLRFSVVDDMYKPSETIGGKETLLSLAKKYFNQPKRRNQSKPVRGYFCESCVVLIDMTHSFWLRNHIALKGYKRTRELMATERVVFQQTGARFKRNQSAVMVLDSPPPAENNENPSEVAEDNNVITIDDDSNEGIDQLEATFVKEEPQLTEPDTWDPVPTVPPDDEMSVKCFICNQLFQDRQILTEHIASSHKRTRRVCNVCNDEFYSALSYNDHMDTHRTFRCNHCPMLFTQRRDVVFHEITQHIGEKLLKECDVCGKMFRCREMLNNHRWTEHGQM